MHTVNSIHREHTKSINTEILTKQTKVISPSFLRGGPTLVRKVRDVLKPAAIETPRF